jgi:hypothetical protein
MVASHECEFDGAPGTHLNLVRCKTNPVSQGLADLFIGEGIDCTQEHTLVYFLPLSSALCILCDNTLK